MGANKKLPKQSPKKVVPKKTVKPSPLTNFINKNGLAITLGLVSVLILILFNDYIFGKLYYIFYDIAMDSMDSFYPHLVHVSNYIRSDGIPMWSFSQGMGQNIMPSSLADPFCWVVYLAGPGYAAGAIIWMEILKIFVAALAFYHFLKLWKLSSTTVITGTLFYCFCGFIIVGSAWENFSTEACYLAILLLGFELVYQKNQWYLFPIAIALFAIHNPFELYMSGTFLILYFLFRHFSSDDPSLKKLFRMVLKLAGLSLLGVLLGSVIFIGNCIMLIESPRVGGHSSLFNTLVSVPVFAFERKEYYLTAVMRFFSSDLLGNGKTFNGWHNYLEAPLFYIGLLPLLLMFQLFFFLKGRKEVVFMSLLFILLVPVLFPFFRYAFFLFTGDYYRVFSLFVSLTFLLFGLIVLDKIDKTSSINIYILAGTLVLFLIILYFPYTALITNFNLDGSPYTFAQSHNTILVVNPDVRSAIRNFLVLYSLVIFLFRYENARPYLRVSLILLVCVEIAYLTSITTKERAAFSKTDMESKFDYNDYAKDAVDFIKASDKQFFRINKSFRFGKTQQFPYNDAQVQNYFGTSSYNSFNQKYYIRALEDLGAIRKGNEYDSRFSVGLALRPLLWSNASIKYQLSASTDKIAMSIGFDSIAKFGNVIVYKNRFFLPLGHTYEKYIPSSQFASLSELQKYFLLKKAFIAEEPVNPEFIKNLKAFDLKDTLKNFLITDYIQDIGTLKQDTLSIRSFNQNHITGTIKLEKPKLLFFSIPYDRGWYALIDQTKIKPILCNFGFQGFLITPGQHTVELIYRPPYMIESLLGSLIGILIFAGLIIAQHFKRIRKLKFSGERKIPIDKET